MTYRNVVSAAEQHLGQQFEGDVRGGYGGHLGVVVGGGDLDHIRADQAGPGQLASTESLAEVWLAMRTTAAVPEG